MDLVIQAIMFILLHFLLEKFLFHLKFPQVVLPCWEILFSSILQLIKFHFLVVLISEILQCLFSLFNVSSYYHNWGKIRWAKLSWIPPNKFFTVKLSRCLMFKALKQCHYTKLLYGKTFVVL